MQNKLFATAIMVMLTSVSLGAVWFLNPTGAVSSLDVEIKRGGAIEKKPKESFIVKVTFRNKGDSMGVWRASVTFEGDWIWKGEQRLVTLKGESKKTLTWKGEVPEVTSPGGIARLIVYYDNKFASLDWWICVTHDENLCVVDSRVS